MLTRLVRTLTNRLQVMDVPVYLADCIPEGAAFPYFTAEIVPPLTPAAAGKLILTLWCRSGSANAERFFLMDALLTRLPARGAALDTGEGRALLLQEGGVVCVHARETLGLRTTWALRFYPAKEANP